MKKILIIISFLVFTLQIDAKTVVTTKEYYIVFNISLVYYGSGIGANITTDDLNLVEEYDTRAETNTRLMHLGFGTFNVPYALPSISELTYNYTRVYSNEITEYVDSTAIYSIIQTGWNEISDPDSLEQSKIKYYAWYYLDYQSKIKYLDPVVWRYRLKLGPDAIKDTSLILTQLKSTITMENLPRHNYILNKVEVYFTWLSLAERNAIDAIKIEKGWNNVDLKYERFTELD